MLNTMSEKKGRKLIEFKIVKSPQKEIPESTASACSPLGKNRNSQNLNKKKISSKSEYGEPLQNTLYSNFITQDSTSHKSQVRLDLLVTNFITFSGAQIPRQRKRKNFE